MDWPGLVFINMLRKRQSSTKYVWGDYIQLLQLEQINAFIVLFWGKRDSNKTFPHEHFPGISDNSDTRMFVVEIGLGRIVHHHVTDSPLDSWSLR